MERGRKLIWYKINNEDAHPCNKMFVNAVNCGTVGDTHPEEIVVDDLCATQCNEAYTTVQLPASAGGNVLPLCVF